MISVLQKNIILALIDIFSVFCNVILIHKDHTYWQVISARRFATLIDLINRIGPCNRMIDYRKQKSIISECTEHSASFAEVQL